MSDKIQKSIIELVTFIPGVAGITTLDFNKVATSLDESEWTSGVSVTETTKGFDVSLSLIIRKDIHAKTIARELESAIRGLSKKDKFKVANVNLYIRGVK